MRSFKPYGHSSLILLFMVLNVLNKASGLQFNYSTFPTGSESDLNFSGGAGVASNALQITPSTGDQTDQSGRVLYKEPFKLRRSNGSTDVSITTDFVLNIYPLTQPAGGEGVAFILTSNPGVPSNSSGQWLGLVDNQTNGSPLNYLVAVEFDTRKSYAEDLDNNHVGLDINSIKSVSQMSCSCVSINLSSGHDITVDIRYYGASHFLEVIAVQDDELQQTQILYYAWYVDLSLYLSEDVFVGFSGSTGGFTQLNQIKAWNFTSYDTEPTENRGKRLPKPLWLLVIVVLLPIAAAFFLYWRRRRILKEQRRWVSSNIDEMIQDFVKGPVKFQLREPRSATANFDPDRKLGKGGGRTVYRGYLSEMNLEVAVKRVSMDARRRVQGFIAEVNAISQLSHRHLVKLIGWCHEGTELLLVYEFLPLGSLDKLIYPEERLALDQTSVLNWERRHRIICQVAYALDYLHNGSSRTVLHRDVKASNVMLDEDYNARLGDFGLARIIQDDIKTHHTTNAVAGTRGYMAPECFYTSRASPEVDVYGFGVFSMEVSCGRRPVDTVTQYCSSDHDSEDVGGSSTYIVDWLWKLYGSGQILAAADPVLNGEYNGWQVGCVLRLSLACCHPNPRERPSMRMVLQVLIGGAAPPELPIERPSFMWPVIDAQHQVSQPLGEEALAVERLLTQGSISGR